MKPNPDYDYDPSTSTAATKKKKRKGLPRTERSDDPDYLEQVFRERARNERFLLPAQSAIDRMISQARTHAQDWIAKSITRSLGDTSIQTIDALREIDGDTRQGVLQGIKAPIGCPSPNTLADILNRDVRQHCSRYVSAKRM